MAAPLGNQFWMHRAKHGRDKIFKTPEALWEAAEDYFLWATSNPLYEAEVIKGRFVDEDEKDGEMVKTVKNHDIVEIPRMRPFTLKGLCIYWGVNSKYFAHFKAGVKDKKDKTSKDFTNILTRIEEIIFTQKFEGAAAGFLKENLIARDLGISDKKELTGKDGERLFPDMTPDQIDQRIKELSDKSDLA